MKILRNGPSMRGIKGPVITLGNFDGIHAGHRLILRKVAERARRLGSPSAVYTFEPHPMKVVSPLRCPPLILDSEDKKALIKALGIDLLVLARFTKEFAALHPREFVEDVLVEGLNVREVWVGRSFSFGKGKLGTVDYLKELGSEFGFKVYIIPPYKMGGRVVSSSRIRGLINEGSVAEAARLIGREFSIKGMVVKGKEVGVEIGFPTANLKVASELIPRDGVYAGRAVIDNRRYMAAVNIGTAPTFGGKGRTVETHIIGFRKNIYGKKMRVEFLRRLRDEKEFKSKDALVRQIQRDVQRVKTLIKTNQIIKEISCG
ncbi:MAG: bifunctional riboflavin kinase/FAD synthetase [Deltaproteobacteria bacterium]|nr:bifunctional riboflavin kinase/FAD synthetase [Deltaproteobacteria bacterium]